MMKCCVLEIFFPAAVAEGYLYNPAGYRRVCKRQIGKPVMYIKSIASA
jgi:hypothetical protein